MIAPTTMQKPTRGDNRQEQTPLRIRRLRQRIGTVTASVALLAFTALMLTPIYILIVVSFQKNSDVNGNPFALPHPLEWQNYVHAFVNMNYLRSVGNTLLITGATAVLTVLVGSLAAWAIVRNTRRWSRIVYMVFVGGLTIPVFVILTPLYEVLQSVHLLDTYAGIILAYTAITLPFAVFFFSGFLRSVPPEVEEAAAVDGAGILRMYWQVVFPLLRPATATLAVFVVLQVWNDLVLPIVLLSSDAKQTVTLAVYDTIGTHTLSTSQLMPTLVLGVLPLFIVFLILQRQVVAGISAGGGK